MPAHPHLFQAAREVLAANDTGVFVKPGPRQYPGQWNWDAAFVAIGLARFDPARARDEVRSLLSGQWDDGMIPHIVFHQREVEYFPGPDVWGRTPSMPAVATSGITQPPLLATAVACIHRLDPHPSFLSEVVPAIDHWHRWFHRQRRPDGGLVRLLHPWESGMDNSPRFDAALAAVPPGPGGFQRRDRVHVPADQRPTDGDYQAYLSIVEALRGEGYRPPPGTALFEVGDVFMSAVLARAEQDLADLGDRLGHDGGPGRRRAAGLERAIMRTWDPSQGGSCQGEARRTIGGLWGFLALPRHPAVDRLVESLADPAGFGPSVDAPWYPTSVRKDDPAFDPRRYWRGPVWANVNWLVAETLEAGRHAEAASSLRHATVDMVAANGFWEYYHPSSGQGLGSDNFSWTAAVVVDLLSRS